MGRELRGELAVGWLNALAKLAAAEHREVHLHLLVAVAVLLLDLRVTHLNPSGEGRLQLLGEERFAKVGFELVFPHRGAR